MKTGCVQNILLEGEDFSTLHTFLSSKILCLQPFRCFYRAKSDNKSFLHSTLCHLASHCYRNIIFLNTGQQENQILMIAVLGGF